MISPNLPHLSQAIHQTGPWSDQDAARNTAVDAAWLADALRSKIKTIDWQLAARDVAPFLPPTEQPSLSLWSERFFMDKVNKLVSSI